MICETCNGKGYQATEIARLKESLTGMLDELCTFRAVEGWNTDDIEDMITKIQKLLP